MKRCALLSIVVSILFTLQARAAEKVVGYYPAWMTTKSSSVIDQNTTGLTHLAYAFLNVNTDGRCEVLRDLDLAESTLGDFKQMKFNTPSLKTVLSIGGASNSKNFPKAAKTEASRKEFVSSCLEFVNDYHFDGVDIDWEFPKRNEEAALIALVNEFRSQLGSSKSISIATIGSTEKSDVLTPSTIRTLAKSIDWFSVMTYDYCDETSKTTCNHADAAHAFEAIQQYTDAGAREDQVLMGIPFYGYKWTVPSLDIDQAHGIGQKVRAKGAEVPYRKIVEKYLGQKNYVYDFDQTAHEPIIANASTNEVISFEDPTSITFKRSEVKKLGLGGLMIWDLTQDDDQFTLLKAATGHSKGARLRAR